MNALNLAGAVLMGLLAIHAMSRKWDAWVFILVFMCAINVWVAFKGVTP